jgi:hypothetical protein
MTDVNTAVLSTQEAAIASSSKMLRPGVTDRVVRLFDAIRAYGPPRVALERAVYFTESFKTTEGQPLVWRWGTGPASRRWPPGQWRQSRPLTVDRPRYNEACGAYSLSTGRRASV